MTDKIAQLESKMEAQLAQHIEEVQSQHELKKAYEAKIAMLQEQVCTCPSDANCR